MEVLKKKKKTSPTVETKKKKKIANLRINKRKNFAAKNEIQPHFKIQWGDVSFEKKKKFTHQWGRRKNWQP